MARTAAKYGRMCAVWAAGVLQASAAAAQVAPDPAPPTAAIQPPGSTCRLEVLADLPMTLEHGQPVVGGLVNGRPVRFGIVTDEYSDLIELETAVRLKLPLQGAAQAVNRAHNAPRPLVATIARLELAGVPSRDIQMLLVGDAGRPGDVDIHIGYEWLSRFDFELDAPGGRFRLLRASHCGDADMPYWATRYSQAPLHAETRKVTLDVKVNGRATLARLSSAVPVSILTPEAARRAGVALAGSQPSGSWPGAPPVAATQVVTLDSFAVGTETIAHPRVATTPTFAREQISGRLYLSEHADWGMRLGSDFLRAHRVLISPGRRMMYFTYAGGPVFAADGLPSPSGAAPAQ